MANSGTEKHLGTSVRRLVDNAIYTGQATYVGDITLPGMLCMGILRSPYAHAELKNIDISPALAHSGVVAAVTGEELTKMCNPLPDAAGPSPWWKQTCTYPLAVGRVRFVGDPVIAVAAVDRRSAREALELIEVEYNQLPTVPSAEAASAPTAPLLYEEWGDNLMLNYHYASPGIDEVFASADYVIGDSVSIQRQTSLPLETRGYVAAYDSGSNRLTFWGSIQSPHVERTYLADVLGLPEPKIRVVQPFVGGGFGLKSLFYPEEPLVCLLAKLTGRPVKWIEDRTESFISGGHSKDSVHHFEAAVRKDGTILALRDTLVADLGAATPPCGNGAAQAYVTGMVAMPGPYRIQHYAVSVLGYVTNKAPWGAYRGYGKQEANFAYERLMDIVASKLHLDPAELRLKNFVQPEEFPYEAATGAVYDSGNYPGALAKALEISEYPKARAEQLEARKQGRYLGIGISCFLEPCGAGIFKTWIQSYDCTSVRIAPDGGVTAVTGITSPGTGNETMIAQVVADELGVEIEDITVLQGDTDGLAYGVGNWSCRSTIVGASSAALAARDLKEKLISIAAHILNEPSESIVIEHSTFVASGGKRSLSLRELARKVYWEPYVSVPTGMEPILESTKSYITPNVRHQPDEHGRVTSYPIWTNGVHVALCEVDIETGEVTVLRYVIVDDCGVALNPSLVDSQVYGAFVSQGLGGTLSENIAYDENCQPLTVTLTDYTIPRASEVPPVTVAHQVTPSPFTVYGSKGCGEGGVIGAAAAITNSVEDALSPFGIKVRSLPLTPHNVWKLIEGRMPLVTTTENEVGAIGDAPSG